MASVNTLEFKTCSQSGFGRRGRALSARARAAGSAWKSPYSIDSSSVSVASSQATFTANVKSSLYPDIKFGLEVRIHTDGVARVIMDEVGGLNKRYDQAASWALVKEPKVNKDIIWTVGKKDARATYGDGGVANKKDIEIVVAFEPLKVTLLRNGTEQVVLNGTGLLHMEHFRTRPANEDVSPIPGRSADDSRTVAKIRPTAWFEGEKEDAHWDETWISWTDTKPKGPESLSLDINFPNHRHVYGIPQHATRLSLQTTTGKHAAYADPYRLYNTDVCGYKADSPMSLYGSIPLMHAHSAQSTIAIFNAIGSETWIDISKPTKKSTNTHWISESGILDIFLLPGPSPAHVFAQYSQLTGTPALPAHWALGYHQCRWNYETSDDIRTVQRKFEEAGMPFDALWLDIEYSKEHHTSSGIEKNFPDPIEMINNVEALGRKMVVIIDPHLKRTRSYPVYQEASDRALLVKPKNGEGEFEGRCWSGNSSWIDFSDPDSWDWWKGLFKTTKIEGQWSWTESTSAVHIWNDMNEPSIFDGPEITMPKDCIHYGGWEHRDIHNINGMLFAGATSQAIMERSDPPKRPFVLTRSFFAGSQRFGAMWTGDNLGTWEHMAAGNKMVLANGIAGMSFAGSDVGGFFGNPEPEMLVRWYQVGAFNPFFRAHAHRGTKRREPFLLDQPYRDMVTDTLRLRYCLLPIWYTAFQETSVTGIPVLRPQYVVFPKDEAGFDIDDQFYVGGSGLLVKPVTKGGVTKTTLYLADDQIYYDYFTYHAYRSASRGKYVTVPAPLHQIPLLMRGGSILPIRERPRSASSLMKLDPFTLRVALDRKGHAVGELYLDDGETYLHREGQVVWRGFVAETESKTKTARISSQDLAVLKPAAAVGGVTLTNFDPDNGFAKSIAVVSVEKVVVVGLGSKPASVKVEGGGEVLKWEYTPGVSADVRKGGQAGVLTVMDPRVLITKDWRITIQL